MATLTDALKVLVGKARMYVAFKDEAGNFYCPECLRILAEQANVSADAPPDVLVALKGRPIGSPGAGVARERHGMYVAPLSKKPRTQSERPRGHVGFPKEGRR